MYLQDGKTFKCAGNIYRRWYNMRVRCTNPKSKSYPMYGAKGVTICKEWESFQAFAQWFVDECIKLGVDPMINDLALDKDTRIKGTKIYAPHTCSLITQSENSKAIAKTYEFISPDGEHVVITNLHQYCKDNNMNQSNMSQLYSGKRKSVKGWTRVK